MAFDEMDRDMKIVGSRPSKDMQPEEDIEEIADNLLTEKESGRLTKADELGRELVSLVFDAMILHMTTMMLMHIISEYCCHFLHKLNRRQYPG